MAAIEQDVLGVLLRTLLSKNLIEESVCDKAKEIILSALDLPEFFEYGVCCHKEGKENGCTENQK